MKRKIYGEGVGPACGYCAHGRPDIDAQKVYCLKRGIMEPRDSCEKFAYDPIRRNPAAPPGPQKFTKEDFEL